MKKKDDLDGMASATRRALARRALGAAYRLEGWVKFLEDEMERQGGWRLHTSEDGNMPFTLKRRDAVHLIRGMGEIIHEIRRFKSN
jgi:hypothetical protein